MSAFGKKHVTQELVAAINQGDWPKAERLVVENAVVDDIDPATGQTILETAIESRYSPFVRVLLEAGADPNYVNARGDSPLMVASRSDFPVEMRMLIAAGADVNWSVGGWTPLRCGARDRNVNNVTILLNAGANVPDDVDPEYPWAAELDAFVREVRQDLL